MTWGYLQNNSTPSPTPPTQSGWGYLGSQQQSQPTQTATKNLVPAGGTRITVPSGNEAYRTPSGSTWEYLPNGNKIVTLAKQFGGGNYTSNPSDTNQVVNSGHSSYGGLPAKAGFQRNDLIPVSQGGLNSSKDNLAYQPLGQAKAQDVIEKQAAQDIKSGKINVAQARIQSMMRNQNTNNPLPTDSANFWSSLKDIASGKQTSLAKSLDKTLNNTAGQALGAFGRGIKQDSIQPVQQLLNQDIQRSKDIYNFKAPTSPMTKDENANFQDVIKGKATPVNDRVAQAVHNYNAVTSAAFVFSGEMKGVEPSGVKINNYQEPRFNTPKTAPETAITGNTLEQAKTDYLTQLKQVSKGQSEAWYQGQLANQPFVKDPAKFGLTETAITGKVETPIKELYAHGASELKDAQLNVKNGSLSKTQGAVEVTRTPKGNLVVLDGQHRVVQAINEGKTTIPTKEIPYEDVINPESDYYTVRNLIENGDHVPFIPKATPKSLQPLVQEAQKYKSAEEFVSRMRGSATQYGDYTPELRKGGISESDFRITEKGIDPELEVTIYRGVPDTKTKIVDGDFVTTDRMSAESYAGRENVIARKVKAKDLIYDDPGNFDPKNPFFTGAEFIYSDSKNPLTKYSESQLTDIYNKAKDTQLSPQGRNLSNVGAESKPQISQPKTVEPQLPKVDTSLPDTNTTKNKVNFNITGETEKQRVQSAIVNSERAKNQLSITGKSAYTAGTGLSAHDIKLAEGYESGTSVTDLAKQADDPAKFTTFMGKLTNYYDLRLAADRAAGGTTARVENYLPHQWDLSDPKNLAKFNDFATQRGLQPYNGFHAQPRVFNSYAEGESLGFKRQNPNILADLKNDYSASSDVISKQVLKQGLQEASPGNVSLEGRGITQEGKPFVNSNIPGLEGISYHPNIDKMLKGYEPLSNTDVFSVMKEKGFEPTKPATYPKAWEALKEGGVLNTVGSFYDRANRGMKHFLLNFSGFHSINVSSNFAGASIFDPVSGVKGLSTSIPSFFSEGLTQKVIDGFQNKMVKGQDFSVFDAGLRSGVNMDRGLPATGLSRFNPLTAISRAMFDRELHVLKLNLVDQVFGNGKVLPESVKGRALGQEINNIMGEMNSHTMNINPNTQKWLSRVLLAPQFTESKYRIIGNALTKGGEGGGNLARQAVLGKSLVMGSLATLGTLLATGKFPNLKQVLLNYTVAPDSQTNLKNPKGQKQDVSFPQTFVSEPSKPIGGLISGLRGKGFDDLTHYGQARLAPVLSDAIAGYTNKDYYGRPIVNPNSKDSTAMQYAKNIGVGDLPIGAQNVIGQLQGKQTGAQTAINIGGLRTHTSPNDPSNLYYDQVKATQATQAKAKLGMQKTYDQVQKLVQQGKTDEAKKIVDGLSNADYKVYTQLKAADTAKATLQAEPKMFETVQKVQDLIKQGKKDEAQQIVNNLSNSDYKIYKLVKTKAGY